MNSYLLKNKLTIVIPTYNEEKYISNTIYHLVHQFDIKDTKVIIADGYSTDKTRDIVLNLKEQYKNVLDIELIDGGKVAYGRNKGALLSKTKFTLFLDADSPLYDFNNVFYNVNLMEKHNYHLLTCKTISTNTDLRSILSFKLFNIINRMISYFTPFAVGGYFLTRTDMFRKLGGFDETLTNSEDYWLSKKYKKDKFHISKMTYGQDDRRFKKMGYFGMLKLMLNNFKHRNDIKHFRKDVGYWN